MGHLCVVIWLFPYSILEFALLDLRPGRQQFCDHNAKKLGIACSAESAVSQDGVRAGPNGFFFQLL